jgi:hypothetical protein
VRKEVRCICVFGNNNTGKSVVVNAIAGSFRKKNPNGFLAAFDPQKRIKGKDIDVKSEEDLNDLPSMQNSMIIFDDFRKIHPSTQPSKWLSDLMDNRYEQGLDLVFVFHSPKRIIEFLTIYFDIYVVFFTNYKEQDIIKKIPDAEIIAEASEIVKKEYRLNGSGEYPFFPHCVTMVNDDLIIKVNFKENHDYGKYISFI